MRIIETTIKDLLIIEPRQFIDDRGYFFESFNQNFFDKLGLNYNFVQDNESKSSFGVLRGLHYQLAPYAQAKLVRAIKGRVFDVAVDLRKGSETFGKWFGVELNEENKWQLLIPQGFAHGFAVLSPEAIFSYKCDQFYNKESEKGIIFNDRELNIDWKLEEKDIHLSDKDKILPKFRDSEHNFILKK
ncbi:MAG: dTDP-4-dehydrorhamnose 3,5-epimerase [Prolixibacteraceae bacterium]|jgi:dTDP-4-dehydrorhamnose 3,5-epimerase|nr:dTDP-4-dehydrorhamnose 3,5-epimerase [Prolixibacteraceae bacterium]